MCTPFSNPTPSIFMKFHGLALVLVLFSLSSIAQTNNRYPYIQAPTETSVTIAWRTNALESSSLNYGTSPTALTQTASSPAPSSKHELTLSNLLPDTRYYYQVNSPTLNSSVETFVTAKPDTQAPFTFLHYGDCGYNNAIQNDIAALMESENADFGVVTGDVDQGQGDDYDNIFFGVYKDMLKRECHFTSIGNHDTYTNNAAPYLDEFHLPTNNPQNSERYYTFTWGNAKFICLDSNLPYTQGSDQYDFLLKELQCNDRQWLMVFFHHPPWTNAWDVTYYIPFQEYFQYEGNDDMRGSLVPLFEQYDVDFVLNGHSHCYQRGEMNGVKYIISGGAGADVLDFNTNSNSPNIDTEIYENQYVIFNIDGDSANFKCINRNGDIIDQVATYKTFTPYSPTVTTVDASCAGNNGAATVILNGPNPPYAVVWSTGATTPVIGGLSPGTYQVTVSDAYGCSNDVLDVVIGSSAPFVVNPSHTDATCAEFQDGTASVGVSGGIGNITYLWSTGSTTSSIVGLAAGTYSVSITDGSGCQAIETFIIEYTTQLNPTIITSTGGTTYCSGEPIELIADAGYSNYAWSNGASTASISVSQTGNFQATVTDNQGCTGFSNELIITETFPPQVTLNASETSCPNLEDGAISSSASSGFPPYSYLWSTGAITPTIYDLTPGTYFLTVTGSNGCSTVSSIDIMAGNTPLEPTISSSTGSFSFCEMEEITLTANSGFDNYTWSDGSNSQSITVSTPGNYMVSVSNASGCSGSSDLISITEESLPTADFELQISGSAVACTELASDETTYLWDFGDGMTSTEPNPSYTYSVDGTYTISLTVNNACGSDTYSETVAIVLSSLINPSNNPLNLQLSPNPFRRSTVLSFSNPQKHACQLNIVNVEGKVVRTYKNIRDGRIQIRRAGLAAGLYFYQLSSENFIFSGKMVIQ